MNDTIKCVSAFVIGAGIGAIVTFKLVKRKYEQIADEEISLMREYYASHSEHEDDAEPCETVESTDESEEEKHEFTEEEKTEYYTITKKYGDEKGGETSVPKDKPYTIPPEEFDELDGYETEFLTYYADGIVADRDDQIIENVDELLGGDPAPHFGEYEDDSVHIRDDKLRCDYEILRDLRTYSEAKRQHYAED